MNSKLNILKTNKSTASSKSQHHAANKKIEKVNQVAPQDTFEEHCLIEEPQITDSTNYREELTYLFFSSAIEHIIENRETIMEIGPTEKVLPELPSEVTEVKELESSIPKILKPKKQKTPANDKPKLLSKSDKYSRKASSIKISRRSTASIQSMTVRTKNLSKKSVRSQSNTYVGSFLEVPGIKSKKEKPLEWIIKPENKVEKIIFKNGNMYEGDTSKWLMHGKGTYTWADGTIYTGEFANGLPDGKGKMLLQDLNTYEGDFCKGFFHGNGVFSVASTPSVYRGSWKNGKKHGYGWCLYEQDNFYEGEWFEDQKHGNGFRQYKDGSRYNGMWSENKKNGKGSMLWHNNDYYIGEWKDDKPHGYGKYIWNTIFTNKFIFPYCSWYKGNWVDGARNGVGIMNFGGESGGRLAGIWKNGEKHGPGFVICGSGHTVICNPLFLNDKPVHISSVIQQLESDEDGEDEPKKIKKSSTCKNRKLVYRRILKQLHSKTNLECFEPDVLRFITQSGLKINENQFVKVDISGLCEIDTYGPLEIPILAIAEEVDLDYFVNTYYNGLLSNIGELSNERDANYSEKTGEDGTSFKFPTTEELNISKNNEAHGLRNLITLYLPKLTSIYHQYATIMLGDTIYTYRAILKRLFLWQLLRDIDLPRKGVSLISLNTFVAKNPGCCLDSDHNPFESIYFWQFIQALLSAAWLLHLTKKDSNCASYETLWQIFKHFLDDHVFPNAGKFVGKCLTEQKDVLPIKYVYDLYLKLGEPLTLSNFLYFTCPRGNTEPPCYAAIEVGERMSSYNLKEGKNIAVGENILFLEAKEDVTSRLIRKPAKEKYTDVFYNTLYTFRSLGRKKIINLLYKVCPSIFVRGKLRMDCKISFLEFYETILLCAYEKTEERVKSAEPMVRQEPEVQTAKEEATSLAARSVQGKSKKKQKAEVQKGK